MLPRRLFFLIRKISIQIPSIRIIHAVAAPVRDKIGGYHVCLRDRVPFLIDLLLRIIGRKEQTAQGKQADNTDQNHKNEQDIHTEDHRISGKKPRKRDLSLFSFYFHLYPIPHTVSTGETSYF